MVQQHAKALTASVRILLLSLLVLQTGACNVFETKDEVAKEARVVISGTAPAPLELITSTRFQRWNDEEGDSHLTLLVSDTLALELTTDHDQIYPIKPDLGFFVKLSNPDANPAVVTMKVYFDGELNYDQQNVSLSESSIEFSFIFSNLNTVF